MQAAPNALLQLWVQTNWSFNNSSSSCKRALCWKSRIFRGTAWGRMSRVGGTAVLTSSHQQANNKEHSSSVQVRTYSKGTTTIILSSRAPKLFSNKTSNSGSQVRPKFKTSTIFTLKAAQHNPNKCRVTTAEWGLKIRTACLSDYDIPPKWWGTINFTNSRTIQRWTTDPTTLSQAVAINISSTSTMGQ